jgi:Tfp pilus assembly protein PilO
MSNRMTLLSGLAAVFLVVLFWLLLWSPRQQDIVALDAQIAAAESEQAQLRTQIVSLRDVRERAPEIEALLAASEAIIPRDPGMPGAVRQLQQAAAEAGLTLRSISPGRPQVVTTEGVAVEPGTQLVSYPIIVLLEGGYFQTVDFLRRVEDPSISPRAFRWTGLNASVIDHPQLAVDVSGSLYAIVPAGGLPEVQQEPAPGASADDVEAGETDEDADVEVDVEVEVTP